MPTFAIVAKAATAEAAKSGGSHLLEQVTASLDDRRLRFALSSLLEGADELRRKTPPLGDPAMSLLLARRGAAEWEPRLAKATPLYPLIRIVLAAPKAWMLGGATAIVSASLDALGVAGDSGVGPRLRHPHLAPVEYDGVALLLIPRGGTCALLPWLLEYAEPAVRAELRRHVPSDVRAAGGGQTGTHPPPQRSSTPV